MCGYCFEGMIIDILDPVREIDWSQAPYTPLELRILESKGFPEAIALINKEYDKENFRSTIATAFFRLWDHLLDEGNAEASQIIKDSYGERLFHEHLNSLTEQHCGTPFEFLGNEHVYFSDRPLTEHMREVKNLTEFSEESIESYIDFWIRGSNKEEVDASALLNEKGFFDPINMTSEKDWSTFREMLTSAFLSFIFLRKIKPESGLIHELALRQPKDCPDFPGLDLWLQRRAFCACVKQRGAEFITENSDDLRPELSMYAILMGALSHEDADRLRSSYERKNEMYTRVLETIEGSYSKKYDRRRNATSLTLADNNFTKIVERRK